MNFTEHTKIRKEKFGTVVFDTLTEKICITDEVGSEILQLVKQGKDVSEILDALANNYEGDREAMEEDVAEFAEQLKSNKIIADSAQE
jgi:Skp family chaperone for outer membrane proteins